MRCAIPAPDARYRGAGIGSRREAPAKTRLVSLTLLMTSARGKTNERLAK